MQTSEIKYLIPEATYHYDHPEVIFWTNYFMQQAGKKKVFSNINSTLFNLDNKLEAARCVADAWYDFACYVPTFLAKAVSKTDEPEWQHHLIQIAYDELGGRQKKNIHSMLFMESLKGIGLDVRHQEREFDFRKVLGVLDKALDQTPSQQGILGLLLSFEIIAEENIETLFNALGYSEEHRESLANSKFFKIHRADETEHIRHSIANFLRFCRTDENKSDFKASFDAGIDFWQIFWDQLSRIVLINTAPIQLRG